ncbi:hypothetical protein SUGI_0226040 [Cryptomeria japonica]|nr:hypothetical protein SUGI_0226040 [Cryptomeria japonica]
MTYGVVRMFRWEVLHGFTWSRKDTTNSDFEITLHNFMRDLSARIGDVEEQQSVELHIAQLVEEGIPRLYLRRRLKTQLCAVQVDLKMSAKVIISSLTGALAVSYLFYDLTSTRKIFGGTMPSTVSNKEWAEETDKKLQAWPRTAGPPVVMNPIRRQNFIVKSASGES